MVIKQGEVYWCDFGVPRGSVPGYRRPVVVIQNNLTNMSAINSVLVCAVTSNLRLGIAPGNVTLRKGEANLSQRSVANVSQLATVDKSSLEDQIGTLSKGRIVEILEGINHMIQPRDL